MDGDPRMGTRMASTPRMRNQLLTLSPSLTMLWISRIRAINEWSAKKADSSA